jgi:hypothetical protein
MAFWRRWGTYGALENKNRPVWLIFSQSIGYWFEMNLAVFAGMR